MIIGIIFIIVGLLIVVAGFIYAKKTMIDYDKSEEIPMDQLSHTKVIMVSRPKRPIKQALITTAMLFSGSFLVASVMTKIIYTYWPW